MVKARLVETILNDDKLGLLQKLGDWFLLYLITGNLDELTASELINEVWACFRISYYHPFLAIEEGSKTYPFYQPLTSEIIWTLKKS